MKVAIFHVNFYHFLGLARCKIFGKPPTHNLLLNWSKLKNCVFKLSILLVGESIEVMVLSLFLFISLTLGVYCRTCDMDQTDYAVLKAPNENLILLRVDMNVMSQFFPK